jgi:porphobilinogen synthase
VRDAHADVSLSVDQLIYPMFVVAGRGVTSPVPSMPEVDQLSPDMALQRIRALRDFGVGRFILFGVTAPETKDDTGSEALNPDNPVCTTLRAAAEADLDVQMIADLCFCEYTSHGHCGALHDDPDITVDNDATLDLLARQARVLARSGAHVVAPSGMMDGQVGAIRQAMDAIGYTGVEIMSYSVKYASAMYGPFRDAAQGAPQFGDRRSYQMDYRRSDEWQVEIQLDIDEGADYVMVKPAATYLDIIAKVRAATPQPLAAYHVSGEYAMLWAAAEAGWLDLEAAMHETTIAIRRAGADLILTYFAPRLAHMLQT